MKLILLLVLSFGVSAATSLPPMYSSIEAQINVICNTSTNRAECVRLAQKLSYSAYKKERFAQACTLDGRLPYCDKVFQDILYLNNLTTN